MDFLSFIPPTSYFGEIGFHNFSVWGVVWGEQTKQVK